MTGRTATPQRRTPPNRGAVQRQFPTARNRRRRAALATVAAVLGLAGLIVALQAFGGDDSPRPTAHRAAGPAGQIAAGGAPGAAPWGVAPDSAGAIRAAGLTPASGEGTAEHYHAHLDVIVDGRAVPVVGGIGVDDRAQLISPLHTHDGTGVVHVEAPMRGTPFYLGQLFREWNVKLTADQLGDRHADATHTLVAYVNGEAFAGNPATIRFTGGQEIALVYAAAGAHPTVPAGYDFPAGE